MKHVKTALSQIDWERSRKGYGHDDPLLGTQSKLRDIRDGGDSVLNETDYALLIQATDNSIRHIGGYDYGPNVDSEDCRQFALQPLFDLRTELVKQIGDLKNENSNQ